MLPRRNDQDPRLTLSGQLSGVSAWLHGGRWHDGYPHGGGPPGTRPRFARDDTADCHHPASVRRKHPPHAQQLYMRGSPRAASAPRSFERMPQWARAHHASQYYAPSALQIPSARSDCSTPRSRFNNSSPCEHPELLATGSEKDAAPSSQPCAMLPGSRHGSFALAGMDQSWPQTRVRTRRRQLAPAHWFWASGAMHPLDSARAADDGYSREAWMRPRVMPRKMQNGTTASVQVQRTVPRGEQHEQRQLSRGWVVGPSQPPTVRVPTRAVPTGQRSMPASSSHGDAHLYDA
jgi:hypothetical protein